MQRGRGLSVFGVSLASRANIALLVRQPIGAEET